MRKLDDKVVKIILFQKLLEEREKKMFQQKKKWDNFLTVLRDLVKIILLFVL